MFSRKTLKERLEEILIEAGRLKYWQNKKPTVEIILKEVKESLKKNLPNKKDTGYKRTEQEPTDIEIAYLEGFNQALSEVKEIIKNL